MIENEFSRGNTSERKETDLLEFTIQGDMHRVLPEYDVVDKGMWGDKGVAEVGGRRLLFYQGEMSDNVPRLVFRENEKQGITVNFHDNVYASDSGRLTQRGGSIYEHMYRGDGNAWNTYNRTVPHSVRLWLEGIALVPDVVDQPAFITPETGIITLREAITGAQDYKSANALLKGKQKLTNKAMEGPMRERFQSINLYKAADEAPQDIEALIMRRLDFQSEREIPFFLGEQAFEAEEIADSIRSHSALGQAALYHEVDRLGIYHELLWQAAVIRPGTSSLLLPE